MSPNNALKLTGPAQATEPRSLARCWADYGGESGRCHTHASALNPT